jgi:hypothetical protein
MLAKSKLPQISRDYRLEMSPQPDNTKLSCVVVLARPLRQQRT